MVKSPRMSTGESWRFRIFIPGNLRPLFFKGKGGTKTGIPSLLWDLCLYASGCFLGISSCSFKSHSCQFSGLTTHRQIVPAPNPPALQATERKDYFICCLAPNLQGAIGSLFLDTRWADQVTLPRFFPRWEDLMLRRSTPSSELEWRTYDWLSLSPLSDTYANWSIEHLRQSQISQQTCIYNVYCNSCVTKMIKMTHTTRHCDCSGLYQTFILSDQSQQNLSQKMRKTKSK